MCAVSYIGDYWNKDFKNRWPQITPWIEPFPQPYIPSDPETTTYPSLTDYVTKEEYEKLKKEMEELKKLFLAAKQYDEATDQPDCEMESKVALIKKLAEALGVDMKDVL